MSFLILLVTLFAPTIFSAPHAGAVCGYDWNAYQTTALQAQQSLVQQQALMNQAMAQQYWTSANNWNNYVTQLQTYTNALANQVPVLFNPACVGTYWGDAATTQAYQNAVNAFQQQLNAQIQAIQNALVNTYDPVAAQSYATQMQAYANHMAAASQALQLQVLAYAPAPNVFHPTIVW